MLTIEREPRRSLVNCTACSLYALGNFQLKINYSLDLKIQSVVSSPFFCFHTPINSLQIIISIWFQNAGS